MSGAVRIILINIALALVYFAGARLGLSLAFVHFSASAVWPPTGIALAAVLLLGPRVWPGIFAGAFAANALTDASIITAAVIAAGNTLEALVGGGLVNRFAAGKHAFERPATVLRFIALAGVIATTISATIGVTANCVAGTAEWSAFSSIWFTWWLGDMVSALIVAPVILVWWVVRPPRVRAGEILELAALASLLFATGYVVFGATRDWPMIQHPMSFVCIPPIVWAAYRFGLHGAVTSTLAMTIIAVEGTMHGRGIFVADDQNISLLLLQTFMGIMALTALVLASAMAERRRIEAELARHRDELETILTHRTAELEASHARLRLADRMSALGALAAGLGHDMGNLLMPLSNRLDALESMILADPAREHVSAIRAAAEYLRQLTTGLRLLARDPERSPVGERADLAAWWKEAHPLLRNAIPPGVSLRSNIDAPDLRVAIASPALMQIMLNLVQNAGDAMRARARGTITIRALPDGDGDHRQVRIDVIDDGPGMSPDMQRRCMEPFVSSKSEDGSIGLGLAIVYDLVTKAGGSVRVDSEIGKGTTFTVILPGSDRRDPERDATIQAHSRL